MSGILSPGTNVALLQAAQGHEATASDKIKNTREYKKFDEAAQEFESVFIGEMLKPMFENISAEAPFGGGKGEEVFRGMLIQEYGKILSKNGGIGLTDQIRNEMIKMQEAANHASTTNDQ